ncbi:MAG TPA: MBL fold metallo-hydrolase [Acidocella sp.]|jgi:glyoxylase-like metal-dependent hydrolase (beta-lactamase superfamily II)|uniref:MBL fold metallo-hydrolase n=1 Tax=Acidocella sp. TaxID=50710 RepID=UPI002BBCF279|nr:MBL fold metallo-hydrolase [Acidocella sp.]HVE23591.1 MBL fold metallo-hydrolase [Acidocella sp.]
MTQMTRRALLAGSAALAASPALASAPIVDTQAPGFYRYKVGDYELTQLSDGAATFPMPDNFVTNVSEDRAIAEAARLYLAPRGEVTVPFNPVLINTGNKLILIDTGYGPNVSPFVGHLPASLAAAGMSPEQIDTVIISHIHPDHTNGLHTKEGALAFPNAEILMPEKDWAFWMSAENAAKADDPVSKAYFANARKTLTDLVDHVGTYGWDKEVAPGVMSIATPGHTPGHTSFAVASGKDRIFVQSDVTNIPAFFLRHPDWHVMYDHDPELAQRTRHRFYDMAAVEKALVVGYHFPFPSLGHVEKNNTGYRLVPANWSTTV